MIRQRKSITVKPDYKKRKKKKRKKLNRDVTSPNLLAFFFLLQLKADVVMIIDQRD